MPVKAGYLLLAAGGGVFVYSGLKNKSVSSIFRQLAGGDSPAGAASAGLGVSGVTAPVSGTAATNLTGINPGTSVSTAGSSVASYQQYAFGLFPSYGWGADQEEYLIELWNQESGWNPKADNPSSGAYGIPQALPGSKMASAGSDWQTNPATQIRWGLGYIKSTYGSPQAAWAHEEADDWY